jgi:enoyl-CoA hydratase/carnithine racemase
MGVITEDRGAVRHLILNRPDRGNALDVQMLRELRAALCAAADDDAVSCVVLRGAGSTFSTGADLKTLDLGSGGPDRAFRRLFLDCANACEEMIKPVVCQIEGTCLGGALEVAIACDFRVASNDAKLGLPEVRFGVIPDIGGCARLPALVGLGRAKELIMTARVLDGPEAEQIGLVSRSVEPERLEAATQQLVDELLEVQSTAVGRVKRVLDASARPTLAAALEMEVAIQEYCLTRIPTGS